MASYSKTVCLSDEQVDWIAQRLEASKLHHADLRDNLLDHFCCFMEEKMTDGLSFEESFEQAFLAITPHGLQEIEQELFFIIHLQTQIPMKRLLYVSGFVATFSFSLHTLLRHLQWEYANLFLQVGFYVVLFAVLPSLASLAYKNRNSLSQGDKVRMLIGILSAAVLSIGMIFKGLHFPLANVLFVTGTVSFILGFLPIFFYQLYQRAVANV
jgi:hypothetical protein